MEMVQPLRESFRLRACTRAYGEIFLTISNENDVLCVFYKLLLYKYLTVCNYLNKFKLIYLKSIAKQVIPTYINHTWPLIPDGIHLFFLTKFERKEKPDLCVYAER